MRNEQASKMPTVSIGSILTRRLVMAGFAASAISIVVAYFVVKHVSTALPAAPNYDEAGAWLCRPGRQDVCATPTTATVFEPNGTARHVSYQAASDPPIDCFYLYPTVSRVRAAYSPIGATADENEVARRQLARFTSVCRPFAPLYRQVTTAGLPALFSGDPRVTIDVPLRDALAAWRHYLAHDNGGRRFVLIGHSQGSRLLAKLIASEIDGKPIQSRLVVAIIPGTRVLIPADKDVGGTFSQVPLCHPGDQTGCVIAYSSYPAGVEVPASARYGISDKLGMAYACVNPAGLAGARWLAADIPLAPALKERFGADFAEFPGEIGAACRKDREASVLAVSVSESDRIGEPTRKLVEQEAQYYPNTGYHSLDIEIALGTLVDLVGRMARR